MHRGLNPADVRMRDAIAFLNHLSETAESE